MSGRAPNNVHLWLRPRIPMRLCIRPVCFPVAESREVDVGVSHGTAVLRKDFGTTLEY